MTARRAKGEGSIYQRADGRWVGSLDLGWHEGKRLRKEVSGKTMREVQVKLADLRRRSAAGLRVDTDQQTVEQFLTRWLTWKEAHVRPRTGYTYRKYLEKHAYPAIGKKHLADLRVDDVQAMLDRRKSTMSARSLQHLRDILRGALNDAIKWGELERNVAAHARPPEQKREPLAPLTNAQAKTLLGLMAGHRGEQLFRLALALGLRRSEICGLQWTAVDLEGRTLKVEQGLQRSPGKGLVTEEPKSARSRREIPLPAFAVDLLRVERTTQAAAKLKAANTWEETGYVFTGPFGRPFDPGQISHEFKDLVRDTDLAHLTFHGLRHAAATMMLAQGVSLKVVQEMLGHSTYHVTADIYGHVAPEVKRTAADAMDRALAGVLAGKADGDAHR